VPKTIQLRDLGIFPVAFNMKYTSATYTE